MFENIVTFAIGFGAGYLVLGPIFTSISSTLINLIGKFLQDKPNNNN